MKTKKKYNSATYNPSRGYHAPGHLRNIFEEIAERIRQNKKVNLSTKVSEFEGDTQFTVGEIIGLLWNCTDILPGGLYDELIGIGLEFQNRTYAAAGQALKIFLS
jgi:hypothetical protein